MFVSSLASYFMGVVQYNKQYAAENIHSVCTVMMATDDSYQNLADLNQVSTVEPQLKQTLNTTCISLLLIVENYSHIFLAARRHHIL